MRLDRRVSLRLIVEMAYHMTGGNLYRDRSFTRHVFVECKCTRRKEVPPCDLCRHFSNARADFCAKFYI